MEETLKEKRMAYPDINKESLQKMEKLLDRSEIEFSKRKHDKLLLNPTILVETISKSIDLYNLVSQELINVLYLEGFIQYKNMVQKLCRGYKHQIMNILKFCLKSIDDKTLLYESSSDNQNPSKKETSKEKIIQELQKSTSREKTKNHPHEITSPDIIDTNHSNTKLNNKIQKRRNTHLILNAQNLIKQEDMDMNPGIAALLESSEFKLFQKILQIPAAAHLLETLVKNLDQYLYYEEIKKEEIRKKYDLQNKELENYLVEHRKITKKIDEILLSKKTIENLQINNSTEKALRQVLKGLDDTKNKVNGVKAINLIDSDDEEDSVEINKAINKEKLRTKQALEKINNYPKIINRPKIDTEEKICQYDREIYNKELEYVIINPLKEKFQIELNSKIGELSDLNKRLNTIEREYNMGKKVILELKVKIANLDVEKNELIKEVQMLKNVNYELESNEHYIQQLQQQQQQLTQQPQQQQSQQQQTQIKHQYQKQHTTNIDTQNHHNEVKLNPDNLKKDQIDFDNLKRENQKIRIENEKSRIAIIGLEQRIKELNQIISELQDNIKNPGNRRNSNINGNGNYKETEKLNINDDNFHLPTENISENNDQTNGDDASLIEPNYFNNMNQQQQQRDYDSQPMLKLDTSPELKINQEYQNTKYSDISKKSQKPKRSLEIETKLGIDTEQLNSPQVTFPKKNKSEQTLVNPPIEKSETKKNSVSSRTENIIKKTITGPRPSKEISPNVKTPLGRNKLLFKFETKANKPQVIENIIQEKGIKNSSEPNQQGVYIIEEGIQTDPLDIDIIQNKKPSELDDQELLIKLRERFGIKRSLSINDIFLMFHKINLTDNTNLGSTLSPKKEIKDSNLMGDSQSEMKLNLDKIDKELNNQTQMQYIPKIYYANQVVGTKSEFNTGLENMDSTKDIDINYNNNNSTNIMQITYPNHFHNLMDSAQIQLSSSQSPTAVSTDRNFISGKDISSNYKPIIQYRTDSQNNINSPIQKTSSNILSALKSVIDSQKQSFINPEMLKSDPSIKSNIKIIKENEANLPNMSSNLIKMNTSNTILTKDTLPNELPKSHSLYYNKYNPQSLHNGAVTLSTFPGMDIEQMQTIDFKNNIITNPNEYLTISDINDNVIEEMYRCMERKIEMNPSIKNIFKTFILNKKGLPNFEYLANSNQIDFEINFNDFKDYVKKFTQTHQKCGEACIHLKRFFEKIGFKYKNYKRPLYALPRTDLDKLPQIRRKVYIKI